MKKLKRKYMKPMIFDGTVGSMTLSAWGRTKREAVKRLRKKFAERGIYTIPEPLVDLLVVSQPRPISRRVAILPIPEKKPAVKKAVKP